MPPVTWETRGAVAYLSLNRPDKRNAINREAQQLLLDALSALDALRVVVLSGAGAAFCSGIDLKEAAAHPDPAEREAANRNWMRVLKAIRAHPAIFIASVNGIALAGGVSLINVCDLALAADEAEIGLPEIGFGSYPGFAGSSTQLRLLPKHAAWMILTAKRLTGVQAEQCGLVNRSVPLARLRAETESLAAHVAQFDPAALAECKRALDAIPARLPGWEGAFQYALGVNAALRTRSSAASDGMQRFLAGQRGPGQGANR